MFTILLCLPILFSKKKKVETVPFVLSKGNIHDSYINMEIDWRILIIRNQKYRFYRQYPWYSFHPVCWECVSSVFVWRVCPLYQRRLSRWKGSLVCFFFFFNFLKENDASNGRRKYRHFIDFPPMRGRSEKCFSSA